MTCYGKTDIGKKRKANQDNFLIKVYPQNVLACIVCDGMGGNAGGEIASETAIRVFSEGIGKIFTDSSRHPLKSGDIASALAHAVVTANAEVYKKAQSDEGLRGMGTTLVAAIIVGDTLYTVNVGDSRLYMANKDNIVRLTHDHSLVQHLIDTGEITEEQAKTYPQKNVITRAVGVSQDIRPDIASISLAGKGGSSLLLCSDGLYGMVKKEDIASCLCKDAETAANELISAANDAGGNDNITAIVIKLD
ncbi:MAG: Stp1/IreP family PP2C-type Ser/Thr phosphatase [Clostridia bacterium]|nr:Stp1/IreP family PP2C-type Ser/Thr phosphatase [Clostridia bacterium]